MLSTHLDKQVVSKLLVVLVLVFILFPTDEYIQWRTEYISNIIITRKP